MRVRIRDLILWQWRPSLLKKDYQYCVYEWKDEIIIRDLIESIKQDGLLTPISVSRSEEYRDWLSAKGVKQWESGKLFVDNGFHRIYAFRRLGRKTIEAEE